MESSKDKTIRKGRGELEFIKEIMAKKFTWSKIEDDYYAYYGEEELGYVEFYKPWKKWVWNQYIDIMMSSSCLENVLKKLKELEGEGSHK